MTDAIERVARALCRYNLRITFPANSAEWIESRVEIEWPMHKQKAEDGIAALRPALEDAARYRWVRSVVCAEGSAVISASNGSELRDIDGWVDAARQEGL